MGVTEAEDVRAAMAEIIDALNAGDAGRLFDRGPERGHLQLAPGCPRAHLNSPGGQGRCRPACAGRGGRSRGLA